MSAFSNRAPLGFTGRSFRVNLWVLLFFPKILHKILFLAGVPGLTENPPETSPHAKAQRTQRSFFPAVKHGLGIEPNIYLGKGDAKRFSWRTLRPCVTFYLSPRRQPKKEGLDLPNQGKGFLGKAGIGPVIAKAIGQIKLKATLGLLH